MQIDITVNVAEVVDGGCKRHFRVLKTDGDIIFGREVVKIEKANRFHYASDVGCYALLVSKGDSYVIITTSHDNNFMELNNFIGEIKNG